MSDPKQTAEGNSAAKAPSPLGVVREASEADWPVVASIYGGKIGLEIEGMEFRFPGASVSEAHMAHYEGMMGGKLEQEFPEHLNRTPNLRITVYEVYGDDDNAVAATNDSNSDHNNHDDHAPKEEKKTRGKIVGLTVWTKYGGDISEPKADVVQEDGSAIPSISLSPHVEEVRGGDSGNEKALPIEVPAPLVIRDEDVKSAVRSAIWDKNATPYIEQLENKYTQGVHWLRFLGVLPEYRRRGIGIELAREGLAHIQRAVFSMGKGCHPGCCWDRAIRPQIVVGLFASSQGKPLYEKLGFDAAGGFTLSVSEDVDDIKHMRGIGKKTGSILSDVKVTGMIIDAPKLRQMELGYEPAVLEETAKKEA